MRSNKGPYKLLLNEEAKKRFGPNLDFYVSKGFFKKYENFGELAKEMNLDP
jgi:hypothetical protein